jgi:hypothetical protein
MVGAFRLDIRVPVQDLYAIAGDGCKDRAVSSAEAPRRRNVQPWLIVIKVRFAARVADAQ